VLGDGVGDVLEEDRLARLGRGHDETPLTEPDGGEKVDDAGGHLRPVELEVQLPGRIEGGEIVEEDPLPGLAAAGIDEFDLADLLEGEEPLPFAGLADRRVYGVAGTEIEAADLAGADVDVVGAGLVIAVAAAEEAETVRLQLQHALGVDLELLVGNAAEEGE